MIIIAFEGLDGAGKTTILPHVAATLRAMSPTRKVVQAGEFQSAIGPQLQVSLPSLNPFEKVLWFAADRMSVLSHITEVTAGEDTIVLWDRYVASAIAYRSADAYSLTQPEARRLVEFVYEVNKVFPPPDLYLELRLSAEQSMLRKPGPMTQAFIEQIDVEYRRYFASISTSCDVVDASQNVQHVRDQCLHHLKRRGLI